MKKDAEAPPVNCFAVARPLLALGPHLNNFRRQISSRTAKSLSVLFYLLCETEVSQFDVAIGTNQYILRLQVSIYESLIVEVLNS